MTSTATTQDVGAFFALTVSVGASARISGASPVAAGLLPQDRHTLRDCDHETSQW